MQKYLIVSFLAFNSVFLIAQTDAPTQEQEQMDPFAQFEEIFQHFGFSDQGGGGIFMDTMMIQQFGGSGMENMDQTMDQLMQMMQQQLQSMNFDNMPGFDQLFEDIDIQALPYTGEEGTSPEGEKKVKKKAKKRKTYQL